MNDPEIRDDRDPARSVLFGALLGASTIGILIYLWLVVRGP